MRGANQTSMRDVPQFADHLVIGGGPAGAMVALRLAAARRQVVILEKEPGPHHKVCGEFLSPEAVEYLNQVGVDPLALGATVIRKLRLSAGNKVVETQLPFEALSLSRRALDEALLRSAEEMGGRVIRGIAVETLAGKDDEWHASLGNGECMRAKTVFLATGKHNLRGFDRTPAPQGDLIGFKLHWQLAPSQTKSLRGCMDLFLFGGGYGGISLIENDVANLCLVVRRTTLRGYGAWPELLAAILKENSHLSLHARRRNTAVAAPIGDFADPLWIPRSGCARPVAPWRPGGGDPFIHRRRHLDRITHRRPCGTDVSGRRKHSRLPPPASQATAMRHVTRNSTLAGCRYPTRPRGRVAGAVAVSQCHAMDRGLDAHPAIVTCSC